MIDVKRETLILILSTCMYALCVFCKSEDGCHDALIAASPAGCGGAAAQQPTNMRAGALLYIKIRRDPSSMSMYTLSCVDSCQLCIRL